MEKKISTGAIYKKATGHSKTMRNLMKKHNVSSVAEYAPIRKARKLKETAERKAKHKDKKLGRIIKPKAAKTKKKPSGDKKGK